MSYLWVIIVFVIGVKLVAYPIALLLYAFLVFLLPEKEGENKWHKLLGSDKRHPSQSLTRSSSIKRGTNLTTYSQRRRKK